MRIAEKNRDTKETKIYEKINLDGNGNSDIDTGIGFFDHMLTLFAFHSNFDLVVKADGDLEVCDHHTIEDCGILLGKLFLEALGDKKGIVRYGSMNLPMDEVLCNVTLDISGRPYLVFNYSFRTRNTIRFYFYSLFQGTAKRFKYGLYFMMIILSTVHIDM